MNFVTIASFNNIHDLYPLKVNLEHNGIQCFIKDEFSVQVAPYLSNAIGGIKLQVPEEEVEKALEILREAGYENKEEYNEPAKFAGRFEEMTAKIPILNKLGLLSRFFILLILLAILLKFLFGL